MSTQKKTNKAATDDATDPEEKLERILGKTIFWMWTLLILGLLIAAAIFTLISYTKMPDTEELENPNYEYATLILSDDNKEMGKFFSKNREGVSHEELNAYLIKALVATEDERYYRHTGVDARSLTRAILFMGTKGGASTITQQLAKQFFTKRSRSFVKRVWQKLKEWVIAIQFEKRYTKEEIIAMYLNKFEFTYSAHGISAAAKTYFGKDQRQLTLDEAAILIGMLKNPYTYNPKRFPENATRRRNVVMKQMVRNNVITEEEYDALKLKPINMSNFNRSVHYEGLAPYFRETLKQNVKKIIKEKDLKKSDGTAYNVDEDGLRIYTTIDMDMQRHAEAAMFEHMTLIQKRFDETWRNKDPWSYDATPAQEKQRKDFLNSAVRQSDRYQNLKNKMLSGITQKILDKYPEARMWDADVRRMLSESKQAGYLNKLLKKGDIKKSQRDVYRRLMSDEMWKEFVSTRKKLDERAKKEFSFKTKMNVFAFNKEGEKSVVMSPLDSIKYHQKLMQLGSVAIDPSNGYIKTWVGGIGNKYFKYDHVQADRQVGSTFKPFLYASAILDGKSPCSRVMDVKHEIPAGDPHFGLKETWSPDNHDSKFTQEPWTLKDGLKASKNSISVGLLKEMGSVEPIRNLVENLGISKSKIPPAPAIVLGAAQVNVLEMTAAYSAFANYGFYNKPTFIKKIEDKDGKVIYSSVPQQRRVLGEKFNEVVVHLLQHASSSHTHKLSDTQWGGKTGTTNNFVDGWFMGISPELVVGTWVGGEYNWIRFLDIAYGSGGAMARPYYLKFMNRLKDDPNIRLNKDAYFRIPDGDRITTDCSQYEQADFQKEEVERAKKVKVFNDNWEDEFGR